MVLCTFVHSTNLQQWFLCYNMAIKVKEKPKNQKGYFMHDIAEFRCRPETLSATVVRNILAKVRSHPDRDCSFVQNFDFHYCRYDVSAFCRWSRCTKLIVRLFHRDSCEIWIVKPGDYPLLPVEAFDL